VRRRVWNPYKIVKDIRSMRYLPIAIKLKDKRVIVVGGGKVAERKLRNLLDTGARVCVISPRVTGKIRVLVKNRTIVWKPRCLRNSDIKRADLIIAATDDSIVNEHVSIVARELRIPVNVVDKPTLSDFISPALLRLNKALIAVYTDGKDPVLSRDLKNYLKEQWDDFVSYRNRL